MQISSEPRSQRADRSDVLGLVKPLEDPIERHHRMSLARRGHIRSTYRWSLPERGLPSRRGRERWVVRWIGAASRRHPEKVALAAIDAPGARVIQLSWVGTFGRLTRSEPTEILQQARAIVRLRPLQHR
jgi:hypothetical protein